MVFLETSVIHDGITATWDGGNAVAGHRVVEWALTQFSYPLMLLSVEEYEGRIYSVRLALRSSCCGWEILQDSPRGTKTPVYICKGCTEEQERGSEPAILLHAPQGLAANGQEEQEAQGLDVLARWIAEATGENTLSALVSARAFLEECYELVGRVRGGGDLTAPTQPVIA